VKRLVSLLVSLLCTVWLFAGCAGSSGSAREAPTFTLTPAGTAPATLPPASRIASLLPSFELLSSQIEQRTDGSEAAGLAEGALLDDDLLSGAFAGWKRTWQVTDASGLTGVLELRALAYESESAGDELQNVLRDLSGSTSKGDTSGVASLEKSTSDGKTLYIAAAPAVAPDKNSSVLFVVSLKLPEPAASAFSLVKETASTLAASLPPSFSL
jgi:hypothetical protein